MRRSNHQLFARENSCSFSLTRRAKLPYLLPAMFRRWPNGMPSRSHSTSCSRTCLHFGPCLVIPLDAQESHCFSPRCLIPLHSRTAPLRYFSHSVTRSTLVLLHSAKGGGALTNMSYQYGKSQKFLQVTNLRNLRTFLGVTNVPFSLFCAIALFGQLPNQFLPNFIP